MPSPSLLHVDGLPPSLNSVVMERTGASSTRTTVSLSGTARPSARTDIVFVLDVSATNREAIESGRMADTVWKVLEFVNEFDDDGVDFFLASTLQPGSDGASRVAAALQEGRAPTDSELAASHGATFAGQAASRADLDRILSIDTGSMGLAGVLAPALRAARGQRKPAGRLFIEVVTDGQVVDGDAVIREIVEMSNDCAAAADKARYRLHILGIGDIARETLSHWDSGLDDVAPVDIVASDAADSMQDGAQQVFREMRRSFMSVCDTALLEVHAANLTGARAMGAELGPDESERGRFVESREQLPPDVVFDLSYAGAPTPTSLSLTIIRADGEPESISITLPVPQA